MTKPRPRLLMLLLSAGILALLMGCQGVSVRESAGGPWSQLPEGSTLTLERPVAVPQDRARVFLRGGPPLPQGASMGPSCGLEIRAMSRDGPYTIAAGTYPIVRVQSVWAQVARREPATGVRFQLASAPDGGGTPMIQEGYHFWLGDGPDPNLMRLTCLGMLDDMPRARPPTLEEIRSALGGVATLGLGGP
jgi:hypothetical protein